MSQRPMPKPLPKKPLPQPTPKPIPAPPKNLPTPIPPRGNPIPPPSGPIYVPRPRGQIPPDPTGPFNPNDPNNPYKDDFDPSKWRTPEQWMPIGIPSIPQNTGVVPPFKEVIADYNNPRASFVPSKISSQQNELRKRMLEQKLSQQGNMSYSQPYFGPM